jgi:two-component system phosphate regulon response regulator PhoB
MNEHILVVDDEAPIRDMVRMALELESFRVSDASNAHEALKLVERGDIDLILLDWMMPGITGIDFAARLRRENIAPKTGIIMLTAKDDEDDLVRGLEAGADDYVRKPFSTRELISRVKAVLRRKEDNQIEGEIIVAGKITIDPTQHRVLIDSESIDLSPTEFRLLHFFASHPNRAFTRSQLLDSVWGEQVYVGDRTVDVHIRRLRKVLEAHNCDQYVTTVRGIGYRFVVSDN